MPTATGLLAAVSLFAITGSSRASEFDRDSIIETLSTGYREATDAVQPGRGEALVTIAEVTVSPDGKREEEVEARFVEFAFKGMKTRWQDWGVDGTKKAKPLSAFIDTGEMVYGYIPGRYAFTMNLSQGRSLRRKLGDDFHPETFTMLDQSSVAKTLKVMLDQARDVEITLRSDGKLEIISLGELYDEGWRAKREMLLDPQAGFHLIYYHAEALMEPSGGKREVTYRFDYDSSLSAFYPGKVTYELFEEGSGTVTSRTFGDPERTTTKLAGDVQRSISVQCLTFEQNAAVADDEFTFEALGVPVGTHVVDHARGISYRYRVAESDEAVLDSLLEGVARRADAPGPSGEDQLAARSASDQGGYAGSESPAGSRRKPLGTLLVAVLSAGGLLALALAGVAVRRRRRYCEHA